MKNKNKILITLLLISILFIPFIAFASFTSPKEIYKVYVKGKEIGQIKSKRELEKYINKEQEKIKKEYRVDKVYIPEDVNVEKELTYFANPKKVTDIYKKISEESSFAIDGYEITIGGVKNLTGNNEILKTKTQKVYVQKRKTFTKAVEQVAKSFIEEKNYEDFKNNTQTKISSTGKIIDKIYIENKVKIRKTKISINNKIYMNEKDLVRYLIFGTTSDGEDYIVKSGDTVEQIAFNHKLSTTEFLVTNPKLRDVNVLLAEGQVLKISTVKPQINIVEESTVISDEEVPYQTETKYDENKYTTYQRVEQSGSKGLARVTKLVQKINGVQFNIQPKESKTLKPAINEVIIKGKKKSAGSGYGAPIPTKGEWGWPASCSNISSPYGYRWGTLHDGTDISGCGYQSNIFAAQSGTVEVSRKKTGGYKGGYGDNGEYIIINHHNGYYTIYAHLCPGCRYVREGDEVSKGQVIGGMGDTGAATAVHLHYGMFFGGMPYYGGRPLNPMRAY